MFNRHAMTSQAEDDYLSQMAEKAADKQDRAQIENLLNDSFLWGISCRENVFTRYEEVKSISGRSEGMREALLMVRVIRDTLDNTRVLTPDDEETDYLICPTCRELVTTDGVNMCSCDVAFQARCLDIMEAKMRQHEEVTAVGITAANVTTSDTQDEDTEACKAFDKGLDTMRRFWNACKALAAFTAGVFAGWLWFHGVGAWIMGGFQR